ncbi:RNA-directed DNA polymerase, eukaryota, partial [Tanacetum coccineum]
HTNPPGFTPKEGEEGVSMNVKADKDATSTSGNVFNVNGDDKGFCNNHPDSKLKEGGSESVCSGHFKKSKGPRTGGSILNLLDDVVKVGQVMGYNMDGCMTNMAEIIKSQGVEEVDSVGNSGGILCVWDPNAFRKDYFILLRGVWQQNGMDLLIVVVYAPQEVKEKTMLWEYLTYEINRWKGKVVVTGDFNEVRFRSDRFGSKFNVQGANIFNSFISSAGLVEVELGGCSFTWCHKSANKMSKLDRFFVSCRIIVLSFSANIT